MATSNTKQSRFRLYALLMWVKLPKRMLAPIEGYEKSPLVTLEEAVEPLVSIVPKVKRNVFIVKQNCQEPADDLNIWWISSNYALHVWIDAARRLSIHDPQCNFTFWTKGKIWFHGFYIFDSYWQHWLIFLPNAVPFFEA